MRCDLIHQLKLKLYIKKEANHFTLNYILKKKQIIFQSNLIMFFPKEEEIAHEVVPLKLNSQLI
jgi:hypothetical protein